MGACCSKRKKPPKKRKTDNQDRDRVIQLQRNIRGLEVRKKLRDDKKMLEERLQLTDPFFTVIPEVVMLDHLEKYLERPEDKMNLVSASPAAAKRLEKYRVKWLFSEILPIPTFLAYLSKQNTLNIRLVCRDWKCSVDTFWGNLNEPVEPDYSSYKSIITSTSLQSLACTRRRYMKFSKMWTPNLGDVRSSERLLTTAVQNDLDLMSNFNPFSSRRVSFQPIYQFLGDEEEDDYWRSVFSVLDRFGNELHSTRIYCYSEITTALSIVMRCLERTPSLTTFDCDLFKIFGMGREDLDHLPVTQFPPLPHLTRLTISYGCAPIYESCAIYFNQLVSLQIQNSANFMSWYNPLTHQFPRLRHLAVNIENISHLMKIQSLKSPLREIDIRSVLCNICPSAYFHFVEHFKETLCAIKLDVDYFCDSLLKSIQVFGLLDVTEIDLPHLKTMCLNVIECGYGPVMEPLMKLSHPPEYLEIIVVNCPWKKRLKGHNNQKHMKDMYASNIWTLFPFMKEICVRETPTTGRSNWIDTYYSREGYERLQSL